MITLEAHRCDTGVSYPVVFEGPDSQAEARAVAYISTRSATHVVHEMILFEERWVCAPHGGDEFYRMDEPAAEQPHAISADRFPVLYKALNPKCEHGMSAWLCYGPDHWCSPEEIASGW